MATLRAIVRHALTWFIFTHATAALPQLLPGILSPLTCTDYYGTIYPNGTVYFSGNRQFQVICNRDVVNTEYVAYATPLLSICMAVCSHDPYCLAATYDRATQRCSLRGTWGILALVNGVLSNMVGSLLSLFTTTITLLPIAPGIPSPSSVPAQPSLAPTPSLIGSSLPVVAQAPPIGQSSAAGLVQEILSSVVAPVISVLASASLALLPSGSPDITSLSVPPMAPPLVASVDPASLLNPVAPVAPILSTVPTRAEAPVAESLSTPVMSSISVEGNVISSLPEPSIVLGGNLLPSNPLLNINLGLSSVVAGSLAAPPQPSVELGEDLLPSNPLININLGLPSMSIPTVSIPSAGLTSLLTPPQPTVALGENLLPGNPLVNIDLELSIELPSVELPSAISPVLSLPLETSSPLLPPLLDVNLGGVPGPSSLEPPALIDLNVPILDFLTPPSTVVPSPTDPPVTPSLGLLPFIDVEIEFPNLATLGIVNPPSLPPPPPDFPTTSWTPPPLSPLSLPTLPSLSLELSLPPVLSADLGLLLPSLPDLDLDPPLPLIPNISHDLNPPNMPIPTLGQSIPSVDIPSVESSIPSIKLSPLESFVSPLDSLVPPVSVPDLQPPTIPLPPPPSGPELARPSLPLIDLGGVLPSSLPDVNGLFPTGLDNIVNGILPSDLNSVFSTDFPSLNEVIQTGYINLNNIRPSNVPDINSVIESNLVEFNDVIPTSLSDLNNVLPSSFTDLDSIVPNNPLDLNNIIPSDVPGLSKILPSDLPGLDNLLPSGVPFFDGVLSDLNTDLSNVLPPEPDELLPGDLDNTIPASLVDIDGILPSEVPSLDDVLPNELIDLEIPLSIGLSNPEDLLLTGVPGLVDILTEVPDLASLVSALPNPIPEVPTIASNIPEVPNAASVLQGWLDLASPILDVLPNAEDILPALPGIKPPSVSPLEIGVPSLPPIDVPSISIPAVEPVSLPGVELPPLPDILIPSLPDVELPEVQVPPLPNAALPSIAPPSIDLPDVELPLLQIPSVDQGVTIPYVSLPNINVPNADIPALSLVVSGSVDVGVELLQSNAPAIAIHLDLFPSFTSAPVPIPTPRPNAPLVQASLLGIDIDLSKPSSPVVDVDPGELLGGLSDGGSGIAIPSPTQPLVQTSLLGISAGILSPNGPLVDLNLGDLLNGGAGVWQPAPTPITPQPPPIPGTPRPVIPNLLNPLGDVLEPVGNLLNGSPSITASLEGGLAIGQPQFSNVPVLPVKTPSGDTRQPLISAVLDLLGNPLEPVEDTLDGISITPAPTPSWRPDQPLSPGLLNSLENILDPLGNLVNSPLISLSYDAGLGLELPQIGNLPAVSMPTPSGVVRPPILPGILDPLLDPVEDILDAELISASTRVLKPSILLGHISLGVLGSNGGLVNGEVGVLPSIPLLDVPTVLPPGGGFSAPSPPPNPIPLLLSPILGPILNPTPGGESSKPNVLLIPLPNLPLLPPIVGPILNPTPDDKPSQPISLPNLQLLPPIADPILSLNPAGEPPQPLPLPIAIAPGLLPAPLNPVNSPLNGGVLSLSVGLLHPSSGSVHLGFSVLPGASVPARINLPRLSIPNQLVAGSARTRTSLPVSATSSSVAQFAEPSTFFTALSSSGSLPISTPIPTSCCVVGDGGFYDSPRRMESSVRTFQTTCDAVSFGNNLNNGLAHSCCTTFTQCMDICADNPICLGVSWQSGTGYCYLKERMNVAREQGGWCGALRASHPSPPTDNLSSDVAPPAPQLLPSVSGQIMSSSSTANGEGTNTQRNAISISFDGSIGLPVSVAPSNIVIAFIATQNVPSSAALGQRPQEPEMPQLEEGNSEATSTPTPVPARVVPPIRTTPAPLALVLASPTNSNPESPSINPAIRVSPGNPVVHTPAGPNPTPLGLSGLLNPQPDGPSYPTYPTDDDTEDWDWLTDDDIGNESELSDDPREDGSEPEGGTENDEGSEGEESSGNGEDSDADENNESDQDRDFNSSDSDPEYDSDICRSCYWTTDSGSECATDMDDDPDPEPHPCPTPTAEITVYPSWYTPPPDPNDDLPPLEEIILPIGSYKNLLSNVMPPVGHDAKGVERKEGEEGSASRDGKERNEWNEDPFQQWLKWWVRLVRPQGGEEDLEG